MGTKVELVVIRKGIPVAVELPGRGRTMFFDGEYVCRLVEADQFPVDSPVSEVSASKKRSASKKLK